MLKASRGAEETDVQIEQSMMRSSITGATRTDRRKGGLMLHRIVHGGTLGAMAGLVALSISCGTKNDPVGSLPGDGLPETVTYTEHIRPLLEDNCTGCHASTLQGADRNGAPTGIDFDTYANATQWAEQGNARIQAGSMPPSGGLTSNDRALFQKWVDQGLLE
jgi:hypothetical protein